MEENVFILKKKHIPPLFGGGQNNCLLSTVLVQKTCLIKYELFVRNKARNTNNIVEEIFLWVITRHYMLCKVIYTGKFLPWESKHSMHRTCISNPLSLAERFAFKNVQQLAVDKVNEPLSCHAVPTDTTVARICCHCCYTEMTVLRVKFLTW